MQKLSLLRITAFRHLLTARFFTTLALQAQAVIIGWQIYSLTKDVFLLGLTGLVEAVPAIICALFAGHFVDTTGAPKKIYVLCLGVLMLNTFALLLVAGGIVAVDPAHLVYIIFAGVFVSGLARGFISPCSFTLMSQLIERKNMPSAAAWMSSGLQTASVTGPAMAGLIYGGFGAMVAWCIPAFCITFGFLTMTRLKAPRIDKSGSIKEPAWKSISAGWKYIWNNQTLLSMMALDMFAVLFGGAVAILPAFADQVLGIGSEGLGLLRASPAAGSIVMGLLLALYPLKTVSGLRLLLMVAGFGFCMLGFALSTTFFAAAFFLFFSGIFDSVSMVIRGTMMQLLTPDHMKGRLSSINSMFIISSNEIGAFESGTAARLMGLVPSLVFGACATLAVVTITAMVAPKFRKIVVKAE